MDNIITVTAMDNNGQLCHTAGYGETVDIAAPGVDIYTIFPENDLDFVSGTSIATAFVSATAGLMYSVDASLLPSDVKEIIISTASFHDELSEKCGAKGYLNTGNCVKAVHEKLSARTDKNS